jgi:23S rRNA (guanine2445-N2)-methyltransferase / 23S rRNA (guanine2069-N7)-methyltransferase
MFEGNRRYVVDLEKYLDTGLFLDHRWVRNYVEQNSKNKTFLNLFCYTASVTVAAGIGGAKSSVSVDSSKSYLNWASENFKQNRLNSYDHKTVRSDVFEYLKSATQKFDLIFVDPPTYSNSHSRTSDWDVQRDHKQMLMECLKLLKTNGEIIFSNNYKKFKLDESINETFEIEDLTERSVSPDFIKSKIKRVCYLLRAKS